MRFLSREAGQARRAWLDDKTEDVAEALRYYLGPGFSEAGAGAANALAYMNPVNDIGEAMAAGRDGEYVNMLTHTATAAAPVVAGKIAKAYNPRMADDAAQWLEDALMGVSVNPTAASLKAAPGQFVADEAGNIPIASKQLTPAQQQAQDVLDLLSAGRANEVTDDMLAAADDHYLFQNYDLPMDEASRMARAKEMGFDTDAFHETGADFSAFSLDFPRAGAGDAEMPTGVFTKPTGKSLGLGGKTEAQMPLRVRSGRNLYALDRRQVRMEGAALNPDYMPALMRADDYDNKMSRAYDSRFEGDSADLWMQDYPDEYFAEADRVLDEWKAKNLALGEAAREELDDGLHGAGYDSLTVQNDVGFLGRSTPSTVIFDPRNIRSRFARFDPRLKHLANLSAAGAGIAYLTPQEEAEIRAYLGE